MSSTTLRTHQIQDALRLSDGADCTLCGWFSGQRRDPKTIELVERTGRIFIQADHETDRSLAASLNPGDVLRATGSMLQTAQGLILRTSRLERLSQAGALPFNPWNETAGLPERDTRLRYRYVDLRRSSLQHLLQTRAWALQQLRMSLTTQGFMEVETPLLERYSPQSTTAFLVPWTGKESFALPQSPQLFKQLLMIGGCDRYFQLARSFRREVGLSAYRQLEFTSLDLEMSFITEEDLFEAVEGALGRIWERITGSTLPALVPHLTWDEALVRYGTDTPDLRFGLELADILDLALSDGSAALQEALRSPPQPGPGVRVLKVDAEHAELLTRQRLDSLNMMNPYPRETRITWAAVDSPPGGGAPLLEGPMSALLTFGAVSPLLQRLGAEPGAILIFIYGKNHHFVTSTSGQVRTQLGKELNLIDNRKNVLVWVGGFPYFEYDLDNRGFKPARHPFTEPRQEFESLLRSLSPLQRSTTWQGTGMPPSRGSNQARQTLRYGDGSREQLIQVRTHGYELVLNGIEVGTGSLRCHDLALQERVLSMFGYTRESVEERFGVLLEAFRAGVPPHGGISIGIDRVLAELTGVRDIGELNAFPKNNQGKCAMTGAPSVIDPDFVKMLLRLDS